MRTLAVIPARGGSKGIPRKNMRLMHGKPLIGYAIANAVSSRFITDVAVTSDSDEILSYVANTPGVLALNRESELAKDAVTLDPVVYDALLRAEKETGASYDVVVTLQPTSPLLTPETLDAALEKFMAGSADSMISVVNAPHLSWKEGEDGVVPAYEKRLNRQQLPANYLETGAFLIARRASVKADTRLGEKIEVFEVPEREATDIDAVEDWVVCESLLGRKRVAFRVDGYRSLGMGHVYRALTLAYALIEHDVVFVCDESRKEGSDFLRAANMKVVEVAGEKGFLEWLAQDAPDVLVVDTLDTQLSFIEAAKKLAGRVVTFEDLGGGARAADAVVNALYEGASPHSNVYTGKKYVCLRDEFLYATPRSFREQVERVLVTFGGTDPLNLTARVYAIAKSLREQGFSAEFDFIVGPAYEGEGIESAPELGIRVHRDVLRMSDFMRDADLALSSQGRTTFELASLGVPTIVLAQNERELLHSFAQMGNGFINLGKGDDVSDEDIAAAIEWLAGATSIRREMRTRMLENDFKSGIARVKKLILGE